MGKTEIIELAFTTTELTSFVEELSAAQGMAAERRNKLLREYPTVYVVHEPADGQYEVYVGETTDIVRRTQTHLTADPLTRGDWKKFADSPTSRMLVIGNEYFNKSLTLDVENRLMLYLSGVASVKTLNNRRANPQRRYFSQQYFDAVFSEIWRSLRTHDKKLFPAEAIIRDSALFKASPFHKLTDEQVQAKDAIYEEIRKALQSPQEPPSEMGHLILVEGAAGTGKTVLLSALFYELFQGGDSEADPFAFQDLDAHLLVNHDEQLTVYTQIAQKLGLLQGGVERVGKPTRFINGRQPSLDADVLLVDEAHLLWTQGKQSYRGTNQLEDLLRRAKVVVAVFDPQQTIAANQYWESSQRAWLRDQTTIKLNQQMRIHADPQTWQWIRRFVDEGQIEALPTDERYDLRVFDSAPALHAAIKQRNAQQSHGLSRLTATFDWAYVSGREAPDGGKWEVTVDEWRLPWNRQHRGARRDQRQLRGLSWAEQPHTIDEVGSIFTVQGFDLNYVGVIIGPSVKYRDGHIVFDSEASANRHATHKRSLLDGSKHDASEELLRNQLNILLTRGVHGLYIFAVDDELQSALLQAQERRSPR